MTILLSPLINTVLKAINRAIIWLLCPKYWKKVWVLETDEFMNVTGGRKIKYYSWCVVLCKKKKKQNREPICVVEQGYPFLKAFYARMYFDEVDADKLESRSLFTNGVNLDMAEDWESLDWRFFFSPKVLAVGIAVPWLENTNHILVYFLLMSNVSLFKNNKFETTSTDLVNKCRAIFIQTCLFVKDSHATSVGFFSSVLNKIHFLVNIFPFAVLKLQYIYIAY